MDRGEFPDDASSISVPSDVRGDFESDSELEFEAQHEASNDERDDDTDRALQHEKLIDVVEEEAHRDRSDQSEGVVDDGKSEDCNEVEEKNVEEPISITTAERECSSERGARVG